MSQDKIYRTISTLSTEIAAILDKVDKGTCSLSEMDSLLDDLRELEERIIIIRYKGMERMRYPESSAAPTAKAEEPYRPPELPWEDEHALQEPEPPTDEVTEEASLAVDDVSTDNLALEEVLEEVAPNQISLIDSIEEISKEASINERMQTKRKKKSVAQTLQSKPLGSVLKALNLNQKMGLVSQVFEGDETKFKSTMGEIDAAADLEAAQAILNAIVNDDQRKAIPVLRTLDKLIKRRFA